MSCMNHDLQNKTNSPIKLNWDESRKRWRGTYRGVRLSVSARALDGSGESDTRKAAKTWFEHKKSVIDSK